MIDHETDVWGSSFDVHHADDGEGVGGGVDAGFEEEVEGERVVGIGAGHVYVDAVSLRSSQVCEGEVVGGERSNGVTVQEVAKDGGCSNGPVVRVGSAEEFVDEEERRRLFAGCEDGAEALDLGEELGFPSARESVSASEAPMVKKVRCNDVARTGAPV